MTRVSARSGMLEQPFQSRCEELCESLTAGATRRRGLDRGLERRGQVHVEDFLEVIHVAVGGRGEDALGLRGDEEEDGEPAEEGPAAGAGDTGLSVGRVHWH